MYHLIKLARLLTDDKNHQNRLIAGNDTKIPEIPIGYKMNKQNHWR